MRKELFNLLTAYSTDPLSIDKIIVSAYLSINKLYVVNNLFLKSYLITESETEEFITLKKFTSYFESDCIELDLETLIEIFEFVVSPSDKIVNGAIYTPLYIREYIVQESFSKSNVSIDLVKSCDISCGCGGFLFTIANHIHKTTNKRFQEIYRQNIYGLDITDYSVNRSKILLSILALEYGEDANFIFNIRVGNALTYKWADEFDEIKKKGGFDLIVGNPPYVASRNMESETLRLMSNWSVSKTGHPDLYIPFFQIGYEALAPGGVLGFITVNTFLKSINGRALREYFATNQVSLKIINFGGEQVFKGRNTYTCLCFISKVSGSISYFRAQSNALEKIVDEDFQHTSYEALNHNDGWNLVNSKKLERYLRVIEGTGRPFKDIYKTKNGIATLKNDVYKFFPVQENDKYYFLQDSGTIFPIEKNICRDIVNSNKLKTDTDIKAKLEKIIFPYSASDGNIKIIPEHNFRKLFPKAYEYLLTKKEVLATRDKGKRKYEEWYAFGRRQSMDIKAYKLFFPHICERPTFVLCKDKDLLFYNGIAVISDSIKDLKLLKKILESDLFFKYIKATTKDYSSGYISMSRNYLKNFGIYQFDESQTENFLNSNDPDEYLFKLYQLSNSNKL